MLVQWHGETFVTLISEASGLIHEYNNHMIIQLTLAPSSTTSSLVLTLPNLDFITAHPSFITAQMGRVTPLFYRPCCKQALHVVKSPTPMVDISTYYSYTTSHCSAHTIRT